MYRFLNLWVFGFSMISQAAFVIAPGRQPINFNICVGQISREEYRMPLKFNWVLGFVGVTSLVVNILLFTKIRLFKNKMAAAVAGNVQTGNESCVRTSGKM